MLGARLLGSPVALAALLVSHLIIGGVSTTSSPSTSTSANTSSTAASPTSTNTSTGTTAPVTTTVTSSPNSSTVSSVSTSSANATVTSTSSPGNSSNTTTTQSNSTNDNTTTSNTTASPTTPSNVSSETTNTTSVPTSVTTTNRTLLPNISVTCESAYSYNYQVTVTRCKISNINNLNTTTRDLVSIECYQRIGCEGNYTSFGSVTTSNSSQGMHYNSSTAYFTLTQPAPNVTTQYTCKFIATGQIVNKTWEFMNVPVKAFFASQLNNTVTQLRLIVNDDKSCLNESIYRNTTAYVYIDETCHPSHTVRNITRDNQNFWEYIFHLKNYIPDTVRLRLQLGNKHSLLTHIFLRRDPDAWPIIGLLGYAILGFIVFMLFALLYIAYILMRQQNPWAYQRLDQEKDYPPPPYYKQW
ncbi:Ba152/Ba151 [Baboon cytomegalovirus]|nr:Ba152/Ba151 [Baboon cytomegalovirus]